MEGKMMYEFMRDNSPNTLGRYIINYVEKLRIENDKMKLKYEHSKK
jgi:hypothetical protein|tara:strand:+ start:398 stop:535 length:138 start_codon:yes stop_codon:yes gene_type:complete